MTEPRSSEPDPGPPSPERVEGPATDEVAAATQADELLAEQIEEAQDSAT
jgi:hypothetical protein